MSFYISTDTVTQAYKELTTTEINNPSLFHIFLILKSIGFNSISSLKVDNISKNGLQYAKPLSTLFSDNEKSPDKYDFINPFDMSEWSSQSASEPMKKWVGGRIKNNVVGGATTWRKLVEYNPNDETIKFKYNYVKDLKDLTLDNKKISLTAISVWYNRFTIFDKKVPISELINDFIAQFKITRIEISQLFHTNSKITLSFDSKLHDTENIRKQIGNPTELNNWTKSVSVTAGILSQITSFKNTFKGYNMNKTNIDSKTLNDILQKDKQVILSGPPGTSKSFLAYELADSFFKDNNTKIQFHPQYSYQEFVGGYVVKKDEVVYEKGIVLNILDNFDTSKGHLLIIDEINRANVSQVFGEMIICLDRNYSTNIRVDGKITPFQLPTNFYIVGTMNTSDRTIGSIDFAVRRRFMNIYCSPNLDILLNECPSTNFISINDFTKKLNDNLVNTLKNKELVIGHAFFLDKNVYDGKKYIWKYDSFESLFNYKILPLVEEFCYNNQEQLSSILGDKLINRVSGVEFEKALQEFIS